VNYLLSILGFVVMIGAFYVLAGRRRTRGEGPAVLLAVVAAFPLLDGGLVLFREYGRSQQGRVVAGVVVGKLSSTGENGSRTIGRRWSRRASQRAPTVVTSEGFQFHDVLARMMMTGSADAWMIEYRYHCYSTRQCWQRESVSHALWSDLYIGQTVNVRIATGQDRSGRLDDNPMWRTALAKLAIGGTLGVLAALVSGQLPRRRRRFVTVPAVVTSVETGTGTETLHWRVRFAYVSADGTSHESADEIYVSGVQPGDDCTAVYPLDDPDLGTLRLTERVSV
jgi:hypothetical protein